MAGPWDKYSDAGSSKPWQKYAQPAADASLDQEFAQQSQLSQQIAGPVQKPETYGESTFAQGASGANEGLASVLGLPVSATTGLLNAGIGGINAVTGSQFGPIKKPIGGIEFFHDLMGGAIQPPTDDPGKQFIRRTMQDVGASVPTMFLPGAGVASQLAMALGSGAAGAAAEQLAPDNQAVQIGAQLVGAFGAKKMGDVARRLVTPFPASLAKQAAAATMRQEGVPLTAGQATGSKGLQYAESELGGGTTANMMENQGEQFTRAVLERAGIPNATRATPDVIDGAFTRIGDEFNDIAANNVINGDQQLVQEIGQAWRDYTNVTNQSQRAPLVENTIRDVMNALNTNQGVISGQAYGALRSQLGQAARAARYKDNQLADALDGIQEALDSAMARGLSPDDAARLTMARQQYRNLLVAAQAASGAGENIALGILSPASIANASKSIYGRRGYVRGRGDLTDLAHAGVGTMSPLPQSGTAPRLAVKGFSAVPAAVGAAIGTPAGIPGMIGGALLGAGTPWAAGKALMSWPAQRYLANQLLDGAPGAFRPVGPMAAIAAELAGPKPPLQITVNGGNGQ